MVIPNPVPTELTFLEDLKVLLPTLDINIYRVNIQIESGHVINLKLSNQDLSELPKSIEHFSALEHLDLSDNHLEILPENIEQLTTLRSLDLSCNYLRILPESIR